MSYGVRNTLILLFFLILILGGGYFLISWKQSPEIEQLEVRVESLQQEHRELSEIVELYPFYEDALNRAEEWIEEFDKSFFDTGHPDNIYRYLTELGAAGPRVTFSYQLQDSTQYDDYGIVTSTVNGRGPWNGVYRLINRIENSQPLQRLDQLEIRPVNEPGEYGNTHFSFRIRSYYGRTTPERDRGQEVRLQTASLYHNPFFPLIRQVEPNEENLPDVENSRLIGLSDNRAFLRDQNGRMVQLRQGDAVYLGRMTAIDVRGGTAQFRLNKGGLIEQVTLEVRR